MSNIPILEEKVPIPVDMLGPIKTLASDAEALADAASRAGVTVTKVLFRAAQLGAQAEAKEQEVETSIRQLLATVSVKPEEYRGLDLENGVVKIQRAPVEAPIDISPTG